MGKVRPPWRTAVVAAVTCVAVAGCATIPTSGAIRQGRDLRVEREDAAVPFLADGPAPGASPAEIVQGFLAAGADFRGDHAVAREFLTDRAAQSWRPSAVTVVHDGAAPPAVEDLGGGTFVARTTELARIDAEGRFHATAGTPEVSRTYALERQDGEWRVGQLDDGLVLSRLDVDQAYRQVQLYFLSPTRNSLVPDSILVPELPGLPTKVMSRLLRGPTDDLRGAVVTAIPQGTGLDVPSVPVTDDGVALVGLDAEALSADEDAREQMSAQIVWTLKQLGADIAKVRIQAGGDDLVVPGVQPEQGRDSWQTYDPDNLPATASLYAVRAGAVGRIIEGSFQPVVGPAGSGDLPLRTPAVTLDSTQLAAVSRDGRTLRVGRLAADGTLDVVLTAGDLSHPSWDPSGNLWVADRSTGRVLLLPGGSGPALPVTLPRLPGRVTGLAVSRDGARIALVVGRGRGARLVLGSLTGLGDLAPDATDLPRIAVSAPREVLPAAREVRDIAWSNASTVTVLGSYEGSPVAPFTTSTDGFDVDTLDPQADLATVAAGPQSAESGPLVAGTVGGRLVQYTSSRGWVPLGDGGSRLDDPAYPG